MFNYVYIEEEFLLNLIKSGIDRTQHIYHDDRTFFYNGTKLNVRPWVKVFEDENFYYCAPLTSLIAYGTKNKKRIEQIKSRFNKLWKGLIVKNHRNEEISILILNEMIPVLKEKCFHAEISTNYLNNNPYRVNFMTEQINFINDNQNYVSDMVKNILINKIPNNQNLELLKNHIKNKPFIF